MASLFRDGQRPPQKVLEIIMGCFRRYSSPLYLGIVSVEIGWSLARTQEMFDELIEQGLIRHATLDEKTAKKMYHDANVYVLL